MKKGRTIGIFSLLTFTIFLPSLVQAGTGSLKKGYINVSKEGPTVVAADLPTGYGSIDTNLKTKAYNSVVGVSLHGTVNGAILTEHEGFDFNGSNAHISVTHQGEFRLTGKLTLEAMVQPEDGDLGMILDKNMYNNGGDNNDNYRLYWAGSGTTGRFYFHMENSSNDNDYSIGTPSVYPAGKWYHVVATYDQSKMKLYVNGKEEVSYTSGNFVPYNGPGPLLIGMQNSNHGGDRYGYFKGKIREVRVWNGVALDAAAIEKGVNKPLKGNEPGLIGDWSFKY